MKGASELLSLAKSRIVSFSTNDASAKLSRLNTQYGLGKIIYALLKRGASPESVYCVFGPDAGVTRNAKRWKSGFGYGCLIRWAGADELGDDILFPQVRPNACGILVVVVSRVPTPHELLGKIQAFEGKKTKINGVSLHWNMGESNHFIEVRRVEESRWEGVRDGDYVALIHASPNELKAELYDFKIWERKGGNWEETPLGKVFVLEGPLAREYFAVYQRIEQCGRAKREFVARELFGDIRVISNATHQGLSEINVMRLGLYDSTDSSTCPGGEPIFPVVLRWDLPVYLVRGKPNLSLKQIRRKGVKRGFANFLSQINILPHGGGYALPVHLEDYEVIQWEGARLFQFSRGNGLYLMSNPSAMPFNYRGLKVYKRIMELGLGEQIATLQPVYTLKS
jgi:hypothetical protein